MMSNTQTNFPTSLPETCFAALDSTDEIVVLVHGKTGYRPTGQWVMGSSPPRREQMPSTTRLVSPKPRLPP